MNARDILLDPSSHVIFDQPTPLPPKNLHLGLHFITF